MFIPDMGRSFGRRSKSKEDLAGIVQQKLHELGYLPVYITSDLERRIRDLQEEELLLRRTNKFTLDRGVSILKEVDSINSELDKLATEYNREKMKKRLEKQQEETQEEDEELRKRKLTKPKSKRKIVKKVTKRKIKK